MNKNIVIVHYNTPYLTECLVRSINLFVEDANIYIFDNSDKQYFTAKFDNVTIIDNTKGKYIDFDKWLLKYPNRNKSNGRVNKWGSAKHCYSVEKCMEIIKENFILLDSDVLLKRDISDLYKDDLIYVGDVITQPNSTIKRVLPFICFINVEKCIENNIHYFDENHMHGLCYTQKNKYADRYDTGSAFYLQTQKLKHEEINCNDYIMHYGHGSWTKNGVKKEYTIDEWTNINRKFWMNKKNRNVIYTCISGNYDTLLEPKKISDNFDYVCFTDNTKLESNVWDIRPLPKETEGLSQIKKQRYVKLNPHLILSEYDLSIWVDGNVEIKGDLNKFIDSTLVDDYSVYVPKHPSRNCIYSEASVVIKMRKDTTDVVSKQIDEYKKEGFPKDYGLLQSNILLRKHNNEDCIKLMEAWFDTLKDGSHRDQLSFNYVCWKNQDIKVSYMDKSICRSEWFNWKGIHTRYKDSIKKIDEYKKALNAMIKHKITTEKVSIYE